MGSHMTYRILLAAVLSAAILNGCTTAAVTGAVGGAATIHDRRTTGAVMDDSQIELEAIAIMNDHPEIDEVTQISPISHNRRLLLIGQASNMDAARRYAKLVAAIPNVRAVFNEVEQGAHASFGDRASDAYMTTKVKLSLTGMDIEGFDITRVNVSTYLDRVYLMGLVTRKEAAAVTDRVRGISGVKKVIDIFEYIDG
jgi:osmotically-inducible protein OsmY